MRTLIYQSSCAFVALWTLLIIILAGAYFALSADALENVTASAGAKQREMLGMSATFMTAIAAASFLLAWSAVVVPFSLIAILARPYWPMTPVSENGAPIRLDRRMPSIGSASPASSPPE